MRRSIFALAIGLYWALAAAPSHATPTQRAIKPARDVRPGRTLLRSVRSRQLRAVDGEGGNHKMHLDASFGGVHPAFRRLYRAGWFNKPLEIKALQKKADALVKTRRIPLSTPLDQVEMLAFDLEATGGNKGKYRGDRRFKSGWDEVSQFGYVVYRGGRVVKRGTIDVKPDVKFDPVASRITKLDAHTQRNAPHFEKVAGQILDLMKGRVLVGQSAIKNDWSWMQSAFARLGVDLPRPKRLILDTHLLGAHIDPTGTSLKDLARALDVPQRDAHNALDDARVTGASALKLFQRKGARTLGDAFRLQHEGYQLMKRSQQQQSQQ